MLNSNNMASKRKKNVAICNVRKVTSSTLLRYVLYKDINISN